MAKVKFNHWARMVAFTAALIMIDTGIISCFYPAGVLGERIVGIYSVVLGVILLPFMAPFRFFGRLLYIFQIFWFAFILLAVMSVILYLTTPTVIAGLTLDLAAVLYLVAAIRKEERVSPDVLKTASPQLKEKI
eukprot:TRINITY_DN89480_c0_g1_i1.p1 TRINITY_DN89480_c0_g1~~TRINITY_DN89480_c0_g1_i1.p1  ORF type:complete len:134 (+),score=4.14 TRINITY_DN89480_c0_g1_i1:45-446(+)